MYIPKRYGESRFDGCPFCGKQATVKSPQKLLVCNLHKDSMLPEIMCVCGSFLVLMEGKFGPFFNCMNCGNINFRKGIEFNEGRINRKKEPELKMKNPRKFEEVKSKIKKDNDGPREITVTSDELDFMFE